MDVPVAVPEEAEVASAGVIAPRVDSAGAALEVATVEVALVVVRLGIARPTTGPTCARSSGTARI